MRTATKWILGIFAVLLLLIVAAGIVLYTFDWNRVKPRINNMVSEATGRTFEIRGDLDVDWQRDPTATGGWRRFVPLPVIQAEDVILGNPEWAEKDLMAEIGRISFGVELPPLLKHTVVLRSASFQNASVAIERAADRNNWTFEKKDQPQEEPESEPWQIAVSEITINESRLAYRDVPLELSIDASITTTGDTVSLAEDTGRADPGPARDKAPAEAKDAQSGEDDKPGDEAARGKGAKTDAARPVYREPPVNPPTAYGMSFKFTGKYREADVEGSGKTGEVLSLRDPEVRFPLLLDLRAGRVTARAEGRIGNLYENPEVDLQVELAAPSMSLLYPLTGIVLPNTPPFATSGHLYGSMDPDNPLWRYDDFQGTVGKSDLQGSVEYRGSGERPSLKGDMRSRLLRFADLGPLVGVGGEPSDPAAKDKAARKGKAKSSSRPGRVLPDSEFKTDRWNAMDVDVRFSGDRIVQDGSLPLDNMRMHAIMDNGVLKLTPIEFGVAEGKLNANITIDGSVRPMKARLEGNVSAVQLPKLFPEVQAMQRSAGRIDGAVALVSRGNSVADLLAEGGGEIKVYLRSGRISRFLLEAASLNVASAVAAKLFGDDEVRIRCAGVSMALKDGLATMRDFRISTDSALIDVTGAIDFAEERLALDVKPESHDLRIVSLRTPLYVNGTFADPEIGLEKGPLLARAGLAAAIVAIAPAAAALLPLTVPGSDKETDCGELLREARRKPSTNPDTSSPIDDKTVKEQEGPTEKDPSPSTEQRGAGAERRNQATTPRSRGNENSNGKTESFGGGGSTPASTLQAR